MNNNSQINDLIIVGAGPVGIYAAYLAQLHGLSGILIEAAAKYGGQPRYLYPDKSLVDLPGIISVNAKQYVQNLFKQFKQTRTRNCLFNYQPRTDIQNVKISEDNLITVEDSKSRKFCSKCLILATGVGGYKPRKLNFKKIDDFKNVIHNMENLNRFSNKKVIVLGGGDSAVDYANTLLEKRITTEVSIVHRRGDFRAKKQSIITFLENSGKIFQPYTLSDYCTQEEYLKAIVIKHSETNNEQVLECDFLVPQIGYQLTINNYKEWDFETSSKRQIMVNSANQSSKEMIWVCGDACFYSGKSRNIVTGFGEVTNAIEQIDTVLNPQRVPNFFTT